MTQVKGMVYERAFLSGEWKNVFIPNAKVSFSPAKGFGPTLTFDTALTGEYALNLQSGDYHVEVKRDGYVTFSTRDTPDTVLSVRDASPQVHDFFLTPGEEHIVTKPAEVSLRAHVEDLENPLRVPDMPSTWTFNLTRSTFQMEPYKGYEYEPENGPKVTTSAAIRQGRFDPATGQASGVFDMTAEVILLRALRVENVQMRTQSSYDLPDGSQTERGVRLNTARDDAGRYFSLIGRTRVIHQHTNARGKVKDQQYHNKMAVLRMTVLFPDPSHLF